MNKQIILTIGMLALMITFVSAVTIIAGDTYEIVAEQYDYYTVEGNSSNLDGFNISWEAGKIILAPDVMYKPDTFTLTFWKGEEVIVEHHHSGGGSCTYDTKFDWECTEWSDCENNNQTRTCKLYNNCHNTYGKPNETQSCEDKVGGETDEHGCQLTAGYTWCENKQKCLREWEEKCEDEDEDKDKVEVEKDYTLIYIILIIIIIIIILGITWWYFKLKNETKN